MQCIQASCCENINNAHKGHKGDILCQSHLYERY